MQQSQTSFHAVSDDIEGIPNPYTQRIIKALEANFVEHIVVFGSRAKGNFHEGSDIDICLFGNFSLAQLWELEGNIDRLELPWKVDLLGFQLLTSEELKEHIMRVGIRLQK